MRFALVLAVPFFFMSCATAPKAPPAAPSGPPPAVAAPAPAGPEDAGIEVVWIRRTLGGHMLDFRYRVTDPERAKELLRKGTTASLVHQRSGAKLEVPLAPKVGKLRQSTMEPEKGRVYFMIFDANRLRVEPGDKVTVIFGKYRFENLTVQ